MCGAKNKTEVTSPQCEIWPATPRVHHSCHRRQVHSASSYPTERWDGETLPPATFDRCPPWCTLAWALSWPAFSSTFIFSCLICRLVSFSWPGALVSTSGSCRWQRRRHSHPASSSSPHYPSSLRRRITIGSHCPCRRLSVHRRCRPRPPPCHP